MINETYTAGNQVICSGGTKTTSPTCGLSGYPTTQYTVFKSTQKRKRPVGLLASMTDYSASRVDMSWSPAMFEWGNQTPIQLYGGAGAPTIPYDEGVSMGKAAQAALLTNMKDMKWNAATSIAEIGKTIAFVTDISRELIQYYKLARKGDILALANLYHARDARGRRRKNWYTRGLDRYLAFRYAVRPLVNDFDSMLKEMANSNVKPVVRRVQGTATYTVSNYSSGISNGEPFGRTTTGTFRHKRVVYFTVDPKIANWKRLGLMNLGSVLWEVTPFSFMFDWILPIGQTIALLDASVGVTQLAAFSTNSEETFSVFGLTYRGGRAETRTRRYSRTIGGGLTMPMPNLAPSLSATKLLDTVAILNSFREGTGAYGFRR